MRKRLWIGMLLAMWAGVAFAAGPAALRKQIESSLLVKGTIDINADGSVAGHALEREAELPSGIVGMISKTVPQWRFEPIELSEGKTRARATMSLRIVARKADDGNFIVRIRGAQFSQERESLAAVGRLSPPRYPENAAYAGVGGSVYLALKVGRDGRVEDAVAEQVNLHVIARERDMPRWREMLAESALHSAREWRFMPPTTGEDVDAPHWTVRVPVDFYAPDRKIPEAHQWQAYIPGPRQSIPWRQDNDRTGISADALAGGNVHPMDGGPRLLTPLDPS
jgi:hypothetical protein